MGKLYDDSVFKQREEISRQQERTNNRLFIIVLVLLGAAVIAVAAWRWFHNPETMVINVNTASVTELQYLPDVGPAIAEAIVKGRPYATPADLKKVKGIGDKTFEKMKARVKVE